MKNERGKMTERREAIDASSGKTGFLVRPLEIHDANAAANTRRASTQPKRTRKCSERALLAAVEYSSAYFLLEPTFLAECVAARMPPPRRATVRWCLGLCVVLLLDGFVFLPTSLLWDLAVSLYSSSSFRALLSTPHS